MSGLAGLRLAAAGVPRWAWVALGAVLLIVAFYLALDAYGDSRYREGKSDADKAWQKASDKLIEDATKAGAKADKKAAARAADFAAKQEEEKEKVDAAAKDGSSPFDVLFGG